MADETLTVACGSQITYEGQVYTVMSIQLTQNRDGKSVTFTCYEPSVVEKWEQDRRFDQHQKDLQRQAFTQQREAMKLVKRQLKDSAAVPFDEDPEES